MKRFLFKVAPAALAATLALACGSGPLEPGRAPTALSQVPAVRMNYRYEADVPPPDPGKTAAEQRNAAVQNDFDQNRPQEVLDKTIASPDGKRVAAVYHRAGDLPAEFRLDMYTSDGRILKKVIADSMAIHFPDTIRWAPDSSSMAFVAMVRGVSAEENPGVGPPPANANAGTSPPPGELTDANANIDANEVTVAPTPAAPTGILAFRTEQVYICNAEGDTAKPITQNEGLIYFYYVWSPDSTMLAALASTAREWQVLNDRANLAGEIFVPLGRPRLLEKNGRERRLDDALTAVQPVWSPDSAKVAAAFDTQIRIYDAGGTNPTQAAIPLRNHLLISSQAYDQEQQSKLNAANTDAPAAQQQPAPQPPATLPDPSTLVSFNPIVAINWTSDDILYFQTAFIKRMKNEADSVTSFPRWHRLILTVQPAAAPR